MTKSSCQLPEDPKTSFLIHLLLHVLILFTVLTLFFMFYISRLERRSFKREMNSLLAPQISHSLDQLTVDQKTNLKSLLQHVDFQKWKTYYNQPSPEVTNNNKWLSTLAFTIIGFLGAVVILLVGILLYSCKMCVNLKEIIVENIVVFLFVGAVEIGFFLLIASKYIPVEPSTISKTMIETLQKKF